jgi:uncharacterized protein with HEPN domain
MSKRISNLLLEDILDAIRKINQYTSEINFQEFLESELISDAVIRNFEIIGEAVNQLTPEVTSLNSHFGVDLAIIWYIIQNDLPLFKDSINKILNDMQA